MHRTTLVLPKKLAAKTKLAAFQKGKTFSKFVTEILQNYFDQLETKKQKGEQYEQKTL